MYVLVLTLQQFLSGVWMSVCLCLCRLDVLSVLQLDIVYKSVSETMFTLIRRGLMSDAESMRKTFKVPPSRFWHITIAAYAKGGRWEKLSDFAKKKSPVGFKVTLLRQS